MFEKTHCEVLGRVAYQIKLSQHQLYLFDQFTGTWRWSKLDCLDEGALECISQNVGSLNLKDVVTECNQISDGIVLHLLSSLQESLHLPLGDILGVEFLIASPCRDDTDILLELLPHLGKESICREFDPTLLSIGDNIDFAKLLGLVHQVVCHIVELSQSLL